MNLKASICIASLALLAGACRAENRPRVTPPIASPQPVASEPRVPKVLASACSPLGLSLGDRFIFWTERCPDGDRLRRAPLDGGEAETLGSPVERGGLHQLVALHDDVVFWEEGAIWRFASNVKQPQKLATRLGGIGFHVFDGSVYWCTHDGIERLADIARGTIETVSHAGETITCLIDGAGIWRWSPLQRTMHLVHSADGGAEDVVWVGFLRGPFVKCGAYVYWADDTSVLRVRDGGTVERPWSFPLPHLNSTTDSAACDEKAIYWTGDLEHEILEIAPNGGMRVVVTGETAWHLAANSSVLCWFSMGEDGTALVKCLDRK